MQSVVRTAIAVAALLVPHLPALGAQAVPAEISAAVADHSRPQTDRDLDFLRRPAAMMAFAGLKSGDTVIEFTPGAGYLTRLLSKVVGPAGHVYSIQFSGTPGAQKAQMKAIAPTMKGIWLVTPVTDMASCPSVEAVMLIVV